MAQDVFLPQRGVQHEVAEAYILLRANVVYSLNLAGGSSPPRSESTSRTTRSRSLNSKASSSIEYFFLPCFSTTSGVGMYLPIAASKDATSRQIPTLLNVE